MSNVNWPDIVISQLNNGSLIRGSDFEVVDTLPLQIDPNSEQSVQAPGAPTGVTVTPGNGQASFSFVPPVDSGGKPVIDYTVTCNPGARTATAPISPITLTGLTNGVALTCSVAARNLVFTSAASATVTVTPGQGMLAAPASVEGYNNPVGGAVTIPINVTNTGSGNTSALSVNLSGPGAAPYSQTSTCSGQSLTPGGGCTIELTFTPQAIGTYVAYLTISGATTSPATVTITLGAIDTPGAPVIGNVVAGNGQAWVFFSPPVSDGGSPIVFYRAMCLPASGSVTADGTGSPILVTGMSNNVSYSCSVLAANMAGNGPLSSALNVTPSTSPSLGLIGVQSRKFHTGVQDFNIAINSPVSINGPVSIEPRAIGTGHRVVFQFNGAINAPGTASAVNASGPVDIASVSTFTNEVIVTLTGIADNQRVTVSLNNVNGTGVNAEASLGFLVGDVNGTGKVNASDISGVKARMGTATNTNFRFDLNTSGTVTLQDISVVKSRSGLALP